MKFYGLLCVFIAASMLLTPAIALVGSDSDKTAAVPPVSQSNTEETTAADHTEPDQERW